MDKDFNGVEYKLENLKHCQEFNFKKWDQSKFIQFCVLSGCDYLDSPKGIGIKRAYDLIYRHGSINHILELIK